MNPKYTPHFEFLLISDFIAKIVSIIAQRDSAAYNSLTRNQNKTKKSHSNSLFYLRTIDSKSDLRFNVRDPGIKECIRTQEGFIYVLETLEPDVNLDASEAATVLKPSALMVKMIVTIRALFASLCVEKRKTHFRRPARTTQLPHVISPDEAFREIGMYSMSLIFDSGEIPFRHHPAVKLRVYARNQAIASPSSRSPRSTKKFTLLESYIPLQDELTSLGDVDAWTSGDISLEECIPSFQLPAETIINNESQSRTLNLELSESIKEPGLGSLQNDTTTETTFHLLPHLATNCISSTIPICVESWQQNVRRFTCGEPDSVSPNESSPFATPVEINTLEEYMRGMESAKLTNTQTQSSKIVLAELRSAILGVEVDDPDNNDQHL